MRPRAWCSVHLQTNGILRYIAFLCQCDFDILSSEWLGILNHRHEWFLLISLLNHFQKNIFSVKYYYAHYLGNNSSPSWLRTHSGICNFKNSFIRINFRSFSLSSDNSSSIKLPAENSAAFCFSSRTDSTRK
jgi:hypothetical protein